MMDPLSELAKLFSERNNHSPVGPLTGRVISPFPLIKISLGERIVLENDELVISETIFNKVLNVDDEVILIPTSSEQKYFLIDRVVNL